MNSEIYMQIFKQITASQTNQVRTILGTVFYNREHFGNTLFGLKGFKSQFHTSYILPTTAYLGISICYLSLLILFND